MNMNAMRVGPRIVTVAEPTVATPMVAEPTVATPMVAEPPAHRGAAGCATPKELCAARA
jgi:hypothetical protein